MEAYEELRRQAVEPDGREEHFEGRGVPHAPRLGDVGTTPAHRYFGTSIRIAFSIQARYASP